MRSFTLKLSIILIVGLIASHYCIASGTPKLKSIKELKLEGIERQTLDYSCGAAALSILLSNYFNDPIQEKDLLSDIIFHLSDENLMKSMAEGFSMLDLKRVAERLGYKADGVRLPKGAASALGGPVIILLRTNKLNHFVVLRGVKEDRAFIIDPSRGHLRMPLRQLYQSWAGEALILSRDDFGLPLMHDLALPDVKSIAPERNTVRALQYSPLK